MTNYANGKRSKAMCAVGGHKVKYKDLKRRWDGLWVSSEEWDPKHEQLQPIRHVYDPQALHHPWPDNDVDDGVATATHPNRGVLLNTITDPTHGETQ